MKHEASMLDVGANGIRVEIKSDNGQVETLLIASDGLPPEGLARQAAIEGAIQSFLSERAFRVEHEALTARIADLQAKAKVLAEKVAEPKSPSSPPFLAELLIASLAPKNTAQAQLGDLQEMFEKNATRIGERQARRKYWIEVARSFGPLLLQWGKRIGFFTVLIDYFRSKFGL